MTGDLMPSDTSKLRDLIGNEPTEEQHQNTLLHEEDDDTSMPVSSNVHEMSFEEALAVAPATGDSDNGLMNWYIPNSRRMPAILRKLADDNEVSFTHITNIALVHGFAIFKHQHSDLLAMVKSFDDVALTDSSMIYFENLNNQKTILGNNMKRLPMSVPKDLMHEMGQVSAMVGTSRSHLAGASVILSLLTSSGIDTQSKTYLQSVLKTFNIGLTLFESTATTLISMNTE